MGYPNLHFGLDPLNGTPYPTKMFVRHLGSTTGERCIQTGFQVSRKIRHQSFSGQPHLI